jgi:ribonuclease Y
MSFLISFLKRFLTKEEKKELPKRSLKVVTKEKVAESKTEEGGVSKDLQKKELELVKLLETVNARERELDKKRAALDEREVYLRRWEQRVGNKEKAIARRRKEAERLYRKQLESLERIAGLTKEQARELVIGETEKKLTSWIAKKIEEFKDQLKASEEELAREILLDAIRHGTTDYVAEYTVSTVSLPNEDVKGKIIGREGRNIRAFERATGVELELDEGNEIRISSFDSVRREVAKIALQKLIRDGRIQPSRIEEVVQQTKAQMDRILLDEGKRICQAVGVYHLPTDLVKTIGKYKYRFSYGQNLAVHTIEETKIGVALANELKADTKVVRLGCLLHDIGKVITDEEGTHVQIGVEFLRKFKLPDRVIACVAEHHEDKQFSSYESAIVWIADAASGSRPGARYQAHEEYLKRMTDIEETVRSFKGVEDVAAYQAGREIRVIVNPEKVSDEELAVLVQNISEKLEEESKWAGQIKVTAIREVRETATVVPNRSG